MNLNYPQLHLTVFLLYHTSVSAKCMSVHMHVPCNRHGSEPVSACIFVTHCL